MNSEEINKSILIDIFNKLEIELSNDQVGQFMTYYEYLIEKNKVMNLTAITEYEDVVLKHFADSVSIVKAYDMNGCTSVIDIGTGAGFPGIPLKIVFPHLKVVLLDSLNKRIHFLTKVIDKIHLDNITAIHSRAEDAAKKAEYREQFDLCVSRAVANLSSLSEYCLPFVKKGGMVISYKSADIDIEINSAGNALKLLGGKILDKKEFCLPDSDIRRALILIEKVKMTPSRYPRKAGLPSKEPL